MPIVKQVNVVTREVTFPDIPLSVDEQAQRSEGQLARARREAVSRVETYFLGLVDADFPGAGSLEELNTLRWVRTAMVPAARSAELTLAADRYVYARNKAVEIQSMDKATAEAYDPAADPGWPS